MHTPVVPAAPRLDREAGWDWRLRKSSLAARVHLRDIATIAELARKSKSQTSYQKQKGKKKGTYGKVVCWNVKVPDTVWLRDQDCQEALDLMPANMAVEQSNTCFQEEAEVRGGGMERERAEKEGN